MTTADEPLSTLAPFPAALPDATLPALVASHDWACLDWPALLRALLAVGRTSIPLGRLTEGHVDAVRILAQAGRQPHGGATYGVWASRSHATGVRATPVDGGWVLDGTLRFASGVGLIERALLPVWLDEERSVLLDLDVSTWQGDEDSWRTPAMIDSRSLTVPVEGVGATTDAQVGDEGFYLGRPGFFPGGVGVAAVWAGGAARVADLTARATAGAPPAPAVTARWGRIRTELACAAALLDTAGRVLASSEPDLGSSSTSSSASSSEASPARGAGGRGQELSTEVRAGVAAASRAVLEECRVLAGPAGMAFDGDLAQALADLDLYVAQQNRDADQGYLGGLDR